MYSEYEGRGPEGGAIDTGLGDSPRLLVGFLEVDVHLGQYGLGEEKSLELLLVLLQLFSAVLDCVAVLGHECVRVDEPDAGVLKEADGAGLVDQIEHLFAVLAEVRTGGVEVSLFSDKASDLAGHAVLVVVLLSGSDYHIQVVGADRVEVQPKLLLSIGVDSTVQSDRHPEVDTQRAGNHLFVMCEGGNDFASNFVVHLTEYLFSSTKVKYSCSTY
jgi:hypothetical protein